MISDSEDRERRSLFHALRDSTLPRLISKDVQAMEMLIYDFFGGFEEAKNFTISSLKVHTYIFKFHYMQVSFSMLTLLNPSSGLP